MDYKISIILPIFNVEPFLRNALDSIISQTFGVENLEVIMVDDCSSDNSGIIMDEYSSKYENFISIHLDKNSGSAGVPRNAGLDRATSNLILFLDPDDEFKEEICEILYNEFIRSNADIITVNAITVKNNNKFIDIIYNQNYEEIIPNNDLLRFKTFRVWGTLYNKEFLDKYNIRFIDVATNEDTYFNYKCFFNASKIIYLNNSIGVIHFERDTENFISLSHKIDKFSILSTIEAFSKISELISISNPNNDYLYDPFIKNIYARFGFKWNMINDDKIDIFEKMLIYEKNSKYQIKLPIQYRFMDYLLNRKMFGLLIIIQRVYSSFVMSKFSKKFLLPKISRNLV